MKAFLIDPEEKTVEMVPHGGDDGYKNILSLIGADLFDAVRLRNGDVIYVDDMGVMAARQVPWHIKGYGAALINKGLGVSIKDDGSDTTPRNKISWSRENISFPEIAVVPGMEFSELDENLKPINREIISNPKVVTRPHDD